jgi:hypothetical protein
VCCFDHPSGRLRRRIPTERIGALILVQRGHDEVSRLRAEFPELPMVAVGAVTDGCPAVVVDNEGGMAAATEHVIRLGRRRIAFIRGPTGHPEAEARLRGHLRALGRRAPEPALVCTGDFTEASGERAVSVFLDERGVRPDAIVAASDAMAFGAMAALNQRGVRVPDDISVIGFDRITFARPGQLDLTSVQQPIAAVGRAAADLALSLLAGRPCVPVTVLPTRLVIGETCGARPDDDIRATMMPTALRPSALPTSPAHREDAAVRRQLIHDLMEMADEPAPVEAPELVAVAQALLDDAEDGGRRFQTKIASLVPTPGGNIEPIIGWQMSLPLLRRFAAGTLGSDALKLLNLAASLDSAATWLARTAERAVTLASHEAVRRADAVAHVAETLLGVEDLAGLRAVLWRAVDRMPLDALRVEVFDSQHGWAGLLEPLGESVAGDSLQNPRFHADLLLPDEAWNTGWSCRIVLALSAGARDFGNLVIDGDPEQLALYPLLQRQLDRLLARLADGARPAAV